MKAHLFAAAALALGLAATAAHAGPTVLTEAQKDQMSECLDQQSGSGTAGAPDACAQFKPGAHGRRTVLTAREQARMSECLDQQSGQGTAGASDTCADFVRPKHGAVGTAAPKPTGGGMIGEPHPAWLAMPVLVYGPGGRQACCVTVGQIAGFFQRQGDKTGLIHNNGNDGFVLMVLNPGSPPYQLEFFEPSKHSRALPKGAVLQNFYVGKGDIYAGGGDISLMMTLGGKGNVPDTSPWLIKTFNLH